MNYVLDASVAAKWALPASEEPLCEQAKAILEEYTKGRCRLLVPDLYWAEVGKVFWKSVRKRRISPAAAEAAIDVLIGTGITTTSCMPLFRDAFKIAEQYDRSVCDSLCVALAATSAATLVTADERLANALAARFPIRWLGAL